MCPFKERCPPCCAVTEEDFSVCARFKVAFIVGIERVPKDMKPIDYHMTAALIGA